MLDIRDLRAQILIATVLACCPFSSRALAQKRAVKPRPLVIVGDGHDVDCVRRIAGRAVEVSPLSSKKIAPSDYGRCAERARRALRFSVYLANAASYCPYERFWRERLARDNPRGQVFCVSHRRTSERNRCQVAAQRAIAMHRVLVSALPKHRQAFDANLAIELDRLRRAQVHPAITLVRNTNRSSRQVHSKTTEGSSSSRRRIGAARVPKVHLTTGGVS